MNAPPHEALTSSTAAGPVDGPTPDAPEAPADPTPAADDVDHHDPLAGAQTEPTSMWLLFAALCTAAATIFVLTQAW